MRVALLTNILPAYRVPVFRLLAATPGWQLRVFLSEGSACPEAAGFDIEVVKGFSFERRIASRGRGSVAQVVTTHLPWGLPGALLRFQPDVVISGELGWRTLFAYALCRLLGAKLVIWSYHSKTGVTSAGPVLRVVRRWLLARAAAVIGMGRQARETLEALGVSRARLFDAPNAHDHDAFLLARARVEPEAVRRALADEFGCRDRIALVAGRLVPMKGVAPLLAAWERLPEKIREDWTLLFVGSGRLASMIEEASAAEPDGAIVHVPEVEPLELVDYYAAARLLIFASLADPWGLVVNEAFACGVPVLCSRHAGCADDVMRPGENGWLFDPTEPAEFVSALREALSAPDLERLARGARDTAERFRPAAMADGMRKAVRFAISASTDRRGS
ncbi:MAG TPA: glycosyltransferase family 4 protein [Myxococcota bacterium]|jgi:glycosyltransferase involved in cell wall biosynthesis